MKEITKNPWLSVREWEEFLYFCCPECNEKNQSKDIFIKHALSIHPMAQICFESIESDVQLKETKNIAFFNEHYNEENNVHEEKLTISIDEDPLVIVKNEVIALDESEEIVDFDSIKEDNTLDYYDDHELSGVNIDIKQPIIVLNRIDAKKNIGKVKSEKIIMDKVNESENKCNLCNEVFSKKSSLIFHKSIDHPETNYAGDLHFEKHETFIKNQSNEKSQSHVGKVNARSSLRCGICEGCKSDNCGQCKSCLDKVQFGGPGLKSRFCTKRRCWTYKNQRLPCTICNKKFSRSYLKIHMKAVHEKVRQWTCDFEGCLKDFAHKEGYLSHLRKHNNVRILCDICGKSFDQRVALKRHNTRIHEDEINEKQKRDGTPFPCNICEKMLFTSELLKDHLQFIHNLKKDEIEGGNAETKCQFCGESFIQKLQLQRHTTSIHEDECNEQHRSEGSPFPCNICQKVLFSSELLEDHLQFIHDQPSKPIKCELCGQAFTQRSTLSNHKKAIHDGIGMCSYCGKRYTSAHNLKTHIEGVHKRSTKCTCTICGRELRDKTVLNYHIKTVHEGIKDSTCETCGKSFANNYGLKAHLAAVHSIGVKQNNICENCGKIFGRKSDLHMHIETVHKGIKKQCQYCEKSFTQAGTLRAHIKKNHLNNNVKELQSDQN